MARDLKDKTVIITGGATGIGFEIADRFLKKGAKVVIILDINDKQGHKAVNTLNSKHGCDKSVFIKCDVRTDLAAVSKKCIDMYKHIDVLVNNAGVSDSPRKTIDTNVTALIEWSLKFWNHMRTDQGGKGGTIMNMASIYGFRVLPYVPVYTASKFAVMGFTRSLGLPYNFDRTGVRVVAINPGYTRTDLTAAPGSSIEPSDKQFQQDLEAFIKEQLWQEPDVVGKAAVDIFERADSGTAWIVEDSGPIVEVKYK